MRIPFDNFPWRMWLFRSAYGRLGSLQNGPQCPAVVEAALDDASEARRSTLWTLFHLQTQKLFRVFHRSRFISEDQLTSSTFGLKSQSASPWWYLRTTQWILPHVACRLIISTKRFSCWVEHFIQGMNMDTEYYSWWIIYQCLIMLNLPAAFLSRSYWQYMKVGSRGERFSPPKVTQKTQWISFGNLESIFTWYNYPSTQTLIP